MRKEIRLLHFWKSNTSQQVIFFCRSVPTGVVCAQHKQDVNRWVQTKWLKKRKVWR